MGDWLKSAGVSLGLTQSNPRTHRTATCYILSGIGLNCIRFGGATPDQRHGISLRLEQSSGWCMNSEKKTTKFLPPGRIAAVIVAALLVLLSGCTEELSID